MDSRQRRHQSRSNAIFAHRQSPATCRRYKSSFKEQHTMKKILAETLTREAFAEFGDVLDMEGDNHYPINGGRAERYHDLARVEAEGPNARVLISIVKGTPYAF